MYFSSLVFYIGLIISTLSLGSLVLWLGIFIFHNYIAAFEENKLEETFGEEYIAYKKKVPKWVPVWAIFFKIIGLKIKLFIPIFLAFFSEIRS